MLTFIKRVLIPGSTAFLLTGVIAGTLLLYWEPAMPWGRAALTALAGGYFLLATPAVSNLLLARLQRGFDPIEKVSDVPEVSVLVILGNGAVSYVAGDRAIHQLVRRTAYCVLEGAHLYDLLAPAWVVVSGGVANPRAQIRPECDLMRDELIKIGLPVDRILTESQSRTTDQQVARVATLLREKNLGDRVVLVTTPAHMRRALAFTRQYGLQAIPAVASKLRYDDGRSGWRRWCPTMAALAGSESAMYESIALVYARLRSRR